MKQELVMQAKLLAQTLKVICDNNIANTELKVNDHVVRVHVFGEKTDKRMDITLVVNESQEKYWHCHNGSEAMAVCTYIVLFT